MKNSKKLSAFCKLKFYPQKIRFHLDNIIRFEKSKLFPVKTADFNLTSRKITQNDHKILLLLIGYQKKQQHLFQDKILAAALKAGLLKPNAQYLLVYKDHLLAVNKNYQLLYFSRAVNIENKSQEIIKYIKNFLSFNPQKLKLSEDLLINKKTYLLPVITSYPLSIRKAIVSALLCLAALLLAGWGFLALQNGNLNRQKTELLLLKKSLRKGTGLHGFPLKQYKLLSSGYQDSRRAWHSLQYIAAKLSDNIKTDRITRRKKNLKYTFVCPRKDPLFTLKKNISAYSHLNFSTSQIIQNEQGDYNLNVTTKERYE